MATAKSPRSTQRARVLDAYRGRGRQNSNLWLGYSVKQNKISSSIPIGVLSTG